MKKILFLVLTAAISLVGCKDETPEVVNKPSVRTYAPVTNESGTVRAYEGDAVTLTGLNLNNVTAVKFEYSVNSVEQQPIEIEATIVSKDVKSLVFAIPTLAGLSQSDVPYTTMFRAYCGSEVVYTMQFFVTVPITDAIVSAITQTGITIGDEITVTGRNLDKVTAIAVHSVSITEFTTATATEIKFPLPVAAYTNGTSQESITVTWNNSGTSAQIIPVLQLTIVMPLGSIYPPAGGTAALGDNVTVTGENLNLLDSVYIGTYKMVIVDRAADGTEITVRIPAAIPQQTPNAVVSWNIIGYFGVPTQSYTMFTGYTIDTTPTVIPVTPPAATNMTAQDGGVTNKAYLKKVVTVAGTNLLNVTGITVGGIAATVKAGTTDTQLQFVIPETFAFITATSCNVVASYQDGTVAFGSLVVYPLYYWANITMGAQDAANQNIAFFLPDSGRMFSTAEWAAKVDPIAYSGVGNTTTATIDKTNITAAEYYGQPAYWFTSNSSASQLAINSPANSNSQLKNFRIDGAPIVPGNQTGTPVILMRNYNWTSASTNEVAYADSVKTGTLRGLAIGTFPTVKASSGAPQFSGTANNKFEVGNVLFIEQVNYAAGAIANASTNGTGIFKAGFIHIKSVSGATTASDGTNAATITFDCYWSRVIDATE